MRTTSSDLANGDMVGNPQCENPEKYQTGKTDGYFIQVHL